MNFKCILAFAFAAVASAAIIPQQHPIHEYPQEQHQHYEEQEQQQQQQKQQPTSQPAYQHAAPTPVYQHLIPAAPQQHVLVQKQLHKDEEQQYENDPHPQYKFSYDVEDAISGDSKSQIESRDGDVVHGEYSLNDADGYRRIVKYTASDVNGFNAFVHREPLQHKVVAVTASAPDHQYQHVASANYAALVANNKAPANHEQHLSHTSYEVPQQNTHENYHHHH